MSFFGMLYLCTVVRVGFQRSEYTTSEDDGSVEVCVTLTGQHQRSISIYVCTQSGTAVRECSPTSFACEVSTLYN